MTTERQRILAMVAQAKITPEEAERLLDALAAGPRDESGDGTPRGSGAAPKFMRVTVSDPNGAQGTKVNIRVPLSLIRAGVRLAAVLPPAAYAHLNHAMKQQGLDIDLAQIKAADLEELIEQLADLTVDVAGDGGEQVRVFCE